MEEYEQFIMHNFLIRLVADIHDCLRRNYLALHTVAFEHFQRVLGYDKSEYSTAMCFLESVDKARSKEGEANTVAPSDKLNLCWAI